MCLIQHDNTEVNIDILFYRPNIELGQCHGKGGESYCRVGVGAKRMWGIEIFIIIIIMAIGQVIHRHRYSSPQFCLF